MLLAESQESVEETTADLQSFEEEEGVALATGTHGKIVSYATASAKVKKRHDIDRVSQAKLQGYQGDACGDCGNFTMVRNGTCLKCNTCGATSGCS